MKKRTFYFDGTAGAGEMLIAIIEHYASVAFPVGGSDCAAASNEALQGIVIKIRQAQSEGRDAEISRRQRPLLKAAVKWFYSESEYASPNELMYKVLTDKLTK